MLPPRYDEQRAIASVESRHRERHLSHARALRSQARGDGFADKVARLLSSLAPTLPRGAERVAQDHDLTDYACRLDDGSMGRVAIRESGGEWVAVCVRVA